MPIFDELKRISGERYVFESFSEQLRAIHTRRGRLNHVRRVREYTPERLKDWMENQAVLYFEEKPEALKFKLHNLRGTAMSVAKMAGVSFEEAAVAFGCHPETMRQHYLALDEVAITDRVMAEIQGVGGKEAGASPPSPDPSTIPFTTS